MDSPELQRIASITQRLTNATNSAEGQIVPPRQIGAFRVPVVTGLRVVKTLMYSGYVECTLTWLAPADPLFQISKYNIFYSLQSTPGVPFLLQGPVTAITAPVTLRIFTTQNLNPQGVVFFIQTELNGGLKSDIMASPSCSGLIPSNSANRRTTVNDVAYTVVSTDYIVAYVTLTAARAVTMLDASLVPNVQFIVKDEAGTAGANNITIGCSGGQTIDGAATKVINTNYGVVRLYSSGLNYFTY